MRILIGILCLLFARNAKPQFVTFKDGKVGVNFGGYHADAGLGGLLTGNAAHGGLSASAGTPWGQRAAAGLGGQVDGKTAGVAYAGAQANSDVGASAVLGGSAGQEGFIGSEAHANGKVTSKMVTTNHQVPKVSVAHDDTVAVAAAPAATLPPVTYEPFTQTHYVQKIKPPKKYTLIKSEHRDHNNETLLSNAKVIEKQVTTSTAKTADNLKFGRASVTNTSNKIKAKNNQAYATSSDVSAAPDVDSTVIVFRERERERARRQRKRNQRPRQRVRVTYLAQQQSVGFQEEQQQQQQQQQQEPQEQQQQQLLEEPANRVVQSKKIVKTIQRPAYAPRPPQSSAEGEIQVQASQPAPNVVFNALNIPIGILRSLQESLGGLGASAHFQKSVQ